MIETLCIRPSCRRLANVFLYDTRRNTYLLSSTPSTATLLAALDRYVVLSVLLVRAPRSSKVALYGILEAGT